MNFCVYIIAFVCVLEFVVIYEAKNKSKNHIPNLN